MPSTTTKKKTIHTNPNQGKNLMTTTTKKKTTATLMAPPTSTAAPPSPAPVGATAVTGVSSGNGQGKTRVINGLVALLGALSANYAANDTFELPSGTYTLPELSQAINAYIAAVSDVGSANIAFHVAVETEQSLRKTTLALRSELKAYIAARIGKSATGMAAYGFAPAKTPTASLKAKVAGTVKAEATRVARGTMGAKQKAEITGNVTSVTITPVTQAMGQAAAPASPVTQSTGQAAAPAPVPVTIPPAKS